MIKYLLLALLFCLGVVQNAFGQIELITNGDFTQLSNSAGGQLGTNETATDWNNSAYAFVFGSGNPGDIAIDNNSFSLWGPTNGSTNGMVLPPGGGNVLASDGAYQVGIISQTINNLIAGKTYQVTFEYAAAQQQGYTTATQSGWTVSLGGVFAAGPGDTSGTLTNSQSTSPISNPSKGFTGWYTATMDFTATSTSETLSFLADGTPTGVPPFALLADVSMTAVPEPSTCACWTILFGLAILFGKRAWGRSQKKSLAAL